MVVEMTALQGVIGRVYALRSGEPEEVARAIYEHYFPGGTDPARPGLAVGLADRLDSLVGLYAVGLAPSGAKDPFALRRAAISLVGALLAGEVSFDLRAGLAAAARVQPVPAGEAALAEVREYLRGRLRGALLEAGYRYDAVDAALAERGHDPALARRAVAELSAWVAKPDWPHTLAAYARCVRITREFRQTFDLHPQALSEPAEVALHAAYRSAAEAVRGARSVDQFALANPAERALYEAYRSVAGAVRAAQSVDQFFAAFTPIIPAVSRFFEQVLVMTEDSAVRENRLGLLQRIAALTRGIADLSRLEGF
jgi:glycyl-tRNA synthetase